MIKQILIPVAAFAVTATGASAFMGGGSTWLENANITDEQKSALQTAREIRTEAHEEAKAVLEAAGLDKEKMKELHEVMHEARKEQHEAMKTALEANDYEAFVKAIADSPLAEKITSEADFAKLAEAHQLMKDGDRDGAKEIMKELGLRR